MADDEEYPPLPPPELPPRAGQGTFLGLKPADILATLGGLLSGVPLGRGPVSRQVHPFNALFPLAQGFANSDTLARQQAGVDALQSQYGGETDLPEFRTAIMLANQGDFRGAMQLLGRGISDRNTRQREDRRDTLAGQAAEAWGGAQAPVTMPGRPALPEAPQVGQDDDYVPATPGTPDVTRPPEVSEIMDRLKAIADPKIRGLAYKAGDATIAKRNEEDAKLRPRTTVHGDRLIREDPRRGTAEFDSELPETTGQQAVRGQREAHKKLYEAQTAKAERDPNAPLGSPMNPHMKIEVVVDPADGVRKKMVVSNWVVANPDAPDGVEHKTRMRPLGAYPFKPFAPRDGAGGTKETLETSEKITPRKRITDDTTFKALQGGVQDVVNEVTNKFKGQGLNFNTPDSYVVLPSGQKVRKEEVLSKAFKARHGVDTTIVWRNGQFFLTQAWAPEQREPMEKRRIVGPAGTIRQNTPQDSSGDEEE